MKKNEPLYVTFQVMEGGNLDVDIRILNPANEVVHSESRSTEGTVDINAATDGRHSVCFGNTISTRTAKLLWFGITAGHGNLVLHEAAKKEHLNPIQEDILKLADKVQRLQNLHNQLKTRSERHKQTADSTNNRALYTSVLESIVLVSVNLWQIHYLRQFFEVKRYI